MTTTAVSHNSTVPPAVSTCSGIFSLVRCVAVAKCLGHKMCNSAPLSATISRIRCRAEADAAMTNSFLGLAMYADTMPWRASKERSPSPAPVLALLLACPPLCGLFDAAEVAVLADVFFGQSFAQCGGSVTSPQALQRRLSYFSSLLSHFFGGLSVRAFPPPLPPSFVCLNLHSFPYLQLPFWKNLHTASFLGPMLAKFGFGR